MESLRAFGAPNLGALFSVDRHANNSGERMFLLPVKVNLGSLLFRSTHCNIMRQNYFAGKNKFAFKKHLIFYRSFFHYFVKPPRIPQILC